MDTKRSKRDVHSVMQKNEINFNYNILLKIYEGEMDEKLFVPASSEVKNFPQPGESSADINDAHLTNTLRPTVKLKGFAVSIS